MGSLQVPFLGNPSRRTQTRPDSTDVCPFSLRSMAQWALGGASGGRHGDKAKGVGGMRPIGWGGHRAPGFAVSQAARPIRRSGRGKKLLGNPLRVSRASLQVARFVLLQACNDEQATVRGERDNTS